MCNCLKEISEKVEERIKSEIESKSTVASYDSPAGFLDNEGFAFSGGDLLFMNYYVKYKRKKVNGSPEVNFTTKKTAVVLSYCPFCGKEYKK